MWDDYIKTLGQIQSKDYGVKNRDIYFPVIFSESKKKKAKCGNLVQLFSASLINIPTFMQRKEFLIKIPSDFHKLHPFSHPAFNLLDEQNTFLFIISSHYWNKYRKANPCVLYVIPIRAVINWNLPLPLGKTGNGRFVMVPSSNHF